MTQNKQNYVNELLSMIGCETTGWTICVNFLLASGRNTWKQSRTEFRSMLARLCAYPAVHIPDTDMLTNHTWETVTLLQQHTDIHNNWLSQALHCISTNMNHLQGAPKSNPLGKIWYLWNCSKFFRQIYSVYRRGFWPHILWISLQYLVAFKNYNYLNLKLHLSKWTSN